ncbi:DUF5316 domain-containing protein [Alicyclobacillus dauci]|uniref:DUF5316 domain-containing protein n=1 Tax=Alicyclobacillus dauci TaxID=1475485 RepID=A0ABY6Z1K9_9BACL|nr:DUF5316 domain-containing protein [Alicyclobacillus dauci]WAH36393.1 DUF5316 domain-containing protein [Alicyclobacillus dauci]
MAKIGFLIGLIVMAIVLVTSLFTGNWRLALKICCVFGVSSWFVSAILSGSMNSGDRMRANLASENIEDRQRRIRRASTLFLMGLPTLVLAVVVYFATLT